jgi:uncharacterized protein (UPF0332 family)
MEPRQQEITLYIQNAHEVLEASQILLENKFYTSAVNRAYYAVFYAANALLVTKGINQGKHSGVISAFRQHFIKTGLIAPEYSQIYGRLMEDRHESDYELGISLTKDEAQLDLSDAKRFVSEVERWLNQENWI